MPESDNETRTIKLSSLQSDPLATKRRRIETAPRFDCCPKEKQPQKIGVVQEPCHLQESSPSNMNFDRILGGLQVKIIESVQVSDNTEKNVRISELGALLEQPTAVDEKYHGGFLERKSCQSFIVRKPSKEYSPETTSFPPIHMIMNAKTNDNHSAVSTGSASVETEIVTNNSCVGIEHSLPFKESGNPLIISCLDRQADDWSDRYEELRQFKEKTGHCMVPLVYPENQLLSNWIQSQYQASRETQNDKVSDGLASERLSLLQEIGLDIALPRKIKRVPDDLEFNTRLSELSAYREEHGDVLVPSKYDQNPKLGNWIKTQRIHYKLFKEGRTSESQLTSERVQALEALGFEWPLPTKLDKKWNQRLEELKRFREINGHCRVPDKFPVNPQLATWVSTQRVQFRLFKEGKKQSMITPSRIEALDKIGFDWGREGCVDLVDWEVRYEELCQYRLSYGNCRVPRNYRRNPQLGNWVHTQRKQYKLFIEGKPSMINRERVAALGRLGFSWSLRPTPDKVDWNTRLKELEQFQRDHGHLLVPRKYKKNPQLGTWVQTQREQYKLLKNNHPSHMNEERIEKLESLGGWVWVARDRVDWDVRFRELRDYKQDHGNCLVPYRYPANPQLGGWVRTQREQYKLKREGKSSHMTEKRIKKLDDLGFVWSLHEIWAQQEQGILHKAIAAAQQKKKESDATASAVRSAAFAVASSKLEVSAEATSAALATTEEFTSTNFTVLSRHVDQTSELSDVDPTRTDNVLPREQNYLQQMTDVNFYEQTQDATLEVIDRVLADNEYNI